MLLSVPYIKQWFGEGGDSGHFLVIFEAKGDLKNPPTLFKFDSNQLQEEGFHNLVKYSWTQIFRKNIHCSATIQFLNNLKNLSFLGMKDVRKKRNRKSSQSSSS